MSDAAEASRPDAPAPLLVLSTDTFRAALSSDPSGFSVTFAGWISGPDPSLISFLDEVHVRLLAHRCRRVTVDFRPLQVLTPPGLEAFIHWTAMVQVLAEPNRYQLEFAITLERIWQRISVLVLQAFAGGLVEILE